MNKKTAIKEHDDAPERLSIDICECCGEPIFSEEDNFNGMCKDCYDTPPE